MSKVGTDTAREPCPDRIFDDVGGAFAMGAIGGSIFHFIKSFPASPKGVKFSGGITAMRMNGPRIGGGFGVWGGLFSICDCTLVYLRQKEDPWNSIMAGAATGGILSVRSGGRVVVGSAALGGVFIALIEGVNIAFQRYGSMLASVEDSMPIPGQQQQQQPQMLEFPDPAHRKKQSGGNSGEGSSWVGERLFGWGTKKETANSGGGSKTEILESFDTPAPPLHYGFK